MSQVRDNSKAALTWLRDKPTNTKCVTTKGSVLNNFNMGTEEDCSDGQVNQAECSAAHSATLTFTLYLEK